MSAQSSPCRLLVIDDDESMLRLVATILDLQFKDEFEVVAYADPIDALAEIEQGKCDVILTDLEMPNVSGIDILKAAKARNPFSQVILLTGHSTHEFVLAALEGGAFDYLLKPIEICDPIEEVPLVKLLAQALKRRKRWQHALAGTWGQTRNQNVSTADS